ncbi:hypothetical protein KR200_004340 [Drosophila serrata]|nr:hypothetical protein KR200_004340 [Drosophila serrata]
MGCSTITVKFLVLLFNFLCAVLGLATIVINALAIKDMAPDGRPILWVFIALGSIVFLTSFLGCFGAIKESICLTWTYAITMLALLIISVVVLFVFRMHIEGAVTAEDELNLAWQKQKNGTDAMSEYQNQFHCCGINGVKDYTIANLTVPESCFDHDTAYTVGCLKEMESFFDGLWQGPKIVVWILMVIEVGFLINICKVPMICMADPLQIASFTFSTILGVTLRNEQRRYGY